MLSLTSTHVPVCLGTYCLSKEALHSSATVKTEASVTKAAVWQSGTAYEGTSRKEAIHSFSKAKSESRFFTLDSRSA